LKEVLDLLEASWIMFKTMYDGRVVVIATHHLRVRANTVR
jgi:hypothetical protein